MNVNEMIPAAESATVLMRSLSHPQRLLVLCALIGEEKSVAELRQQLGIDQVPMSQQLMRLRSDGLVEARREGTTVYYSIARPEVLTIVGALHDAFCAAAPAKRKRPARQDRAKSQDLTKNHARAKKHGRAKKIMTRREATSVEAILSRENALTAARSHGGVRLTPPASCAGAVSSRASRSTEAAVSG
jgi:DNA-binding transcriptional ArsR family regulator